MRKNLLLLFCILTAAFRQSGYAQPTLLSTELIGYGSVMTMKEISNFSVINTAIQGANSTWNFSTLAPTSNPNFVVNIVNPISTPYAGTFPNSNYAYLQQQGGNTTYVYYNKSTTALSRIGSYLSNLNTYTDPQDEYVFPCSLGVVHNDTWNNTNSSTGGTYDQECVGYGTLILPTGTYSNALMVKVHMTEWILDFYAYFWYSSDDGRVLLQYIEGDGIWISEAGYYLHSFTTGTSESLLFDKALYNNPVVDQLNLSFVPRTSGQVNYTVTNTMGQVVLSNSFDAKQGTRETLDIDFSQLSTGLYFFTATTDNNDGSIYSIKLIKQ